MARRIADAVSRQDYAAAIFVADDLGQVASALPMSAIQLSGAARTPAPDVVVAFRSGHVAGCGLSRELCQYEVSDTGLQQGQGNHGGLNRADTRNMMAAIGPDFRTQFQDPAPVGNADWAPTVASVLHLKLQGPGRLAGRVLSEALRDGDKPPVSTRQVLKSKAAANGFVTQVEQENVAGAQVYSDSVPF